MPFMVIYDRADGTSGHEEASAIDEAAHFVERLRNDESIDHIRLFRMEEIAFAFRPYYKVELGMPPQMASAAGIAHPTDPVVARRTLPASTGHPAGSAHAEVAANGVSSNGVSANGASGLFRR